MCRRRNDAQCPGRLHQAPWSTHPSRREQRVFGQPVRVTARATQGRMSLSDGWQLCIPDLSVNRVCWPTAFSQLQSDGPAACVTASDWLLSFRVGM